MARLTWQRSGPIQPPPALAVMDPLGTIAQLLDRKDKEIELWRRRRVEWDAERAQMAASWLRWEAEREEHENTAMLGSRACRLIRRMRVERDSQRTTIAELRAEVKVLKAMEAEAAATALTNRQLTVLFARGDALRMLRERD